MNEGQHTPKDSLSFQIYRRIEEGRCSPTLYASVDLFIGPFLGRSTSAPRLQKLITDIAAPHNFQSSQPLLVVKGTSGAAKGKLQVIGGGHRLLSSYRTLHTLVIPYKVVSLEGIGSSGEELNLFDYKGIIAFHVEVNEPRPQRYGFMQQLLLYEDLKTHWKEAEKARVSKLKGRKARPQAMTHNKLYDFYESTLGFAGTKSRYAIEFLYQRANEKVKITPGTRRQYMSGADRLLDAGVVPYLSELEEAGVASFNRSSLYSVRNWKVEKVRQVVEIWKVRRKMGVKVKYLFSDKAGREVDGKGRGRKGSQQQSPSQYVSNDDVNCAEVETEAGSKDGVAGDGLGARECGAVTQDTRKSSEQTLSLSPHGTGEVVKNRREPPADTSLWEKEQGSRNDDDEHMENSEQKCVEAEDMKKNKQPEGKCEEKNGSRLEEEVGRLIAKVEKDIENEDAEVTNIDLESKLVVLKRGRQLAKEQSLQEVMGLSQLLTVAANDVEKNECREVKLVVQGGFLGNQMTLSEKDFEAIRDFHLATDRSVMFALSFLSKWTPQSINRTVVVDSIRSVGWWDCDLSQNKERLDVLVNRLREGNVFDTDTLVQTWKSEVCFMPICGDGHWSLVVLLNLRALYNVLESGNGGGFDTCQGCTRVLFIDSMGEQSPHRSKMGNIYLYLQACYPTERHPSLRDIRRNIAGEELRFSLQTGLECGFYAAYHASLLCRGFEHLLICKAGEFRGFLEDGHRTFTFEQYKHEAISGLQVLEKAYNGSQGTEVTVPPRLWGLETADWISDNDVTQVKAVDEDQALSCEEPTKTTEARSCEKPAKTTEARPVGTIIEDLRDGLPEKRGIKRKHDELEVEDCRPRKVYILPPLGHGDISAVKVVSPRREMEDEKCTNSGLRVPKEQGVTCERVRRLQGGIHIEERDAWITELLSNILEDVIRAKRGFGADNNAKPIPCRDKRSRNEVGRLDLADGRSCGVVKVSKRGESVHASECALPKRKARPTHQGGRTELRSEGVLMNRHSPEGGFLSEVQEAMALAQALKDDSIRKEWEAYKEHLRRLILKMKGGRT